MISYEEGTINPDFVDYKEMPGLDPDGSIGLIDGRSIKFNRTSIVSDILGNKSSIIQNATDIALNVTDIAGNTSDITINATNIGLNVSDIGENTTNIDINANGISTNVTDISGNTSNISQNATNISLRILKHVEGGATDEILSEINLSEEGTYIGGDNIELDGNTHVLGTFKVGAGNCDTTIIDGGIIITGLLTGATLQTAASGARVVMDSTGIKQYDATTQRAQLLNDGSGWLGSATTLRWTTAGVVALTWANIDGTGIPDDNATVGGILGTNISGGGTSDNQINNSGYISHLSADVIDAGTLNANSITVSNFTVGTNVGLGTAEDSAGVTTIIDGRVTTTWLNAKNIIAGSVAAENITGTYITGKTVRTAASGARVQLDSGSYLQCYDASRMRAQLDTDSLQFWDTNGNDAGYITGVYDSDWSGASLYYYGNILNVQAESNWSAIIALRYNNNAGACAIEASAAGGGGGIEEGDLTLYSDNNIGLRGGESSIINCLNPLSTPILLSYNGISEFLDLVNTDGRLKQNLIPYTNEGKNLGDSTHKFASVFQKYVRADELRNVNGDQIAVLSGAKLDLYRPLVLNSRSTYPGSPDTGEMFWHTTVGAIMVYNGSSWETVSSA